MTQQILIHKYCPDGKVHNVIKDDDAGEILCNHCGIVFEERTVFDDITANTYKMDNDSTKFIGQSNKNVGESTFIPKNMKDYTGKTIKSENKNLFKHINVWDYRVKSDWNNGKLLSVINQNCSMLQLNEITTFEVEKLMKKVVNEKLTKGRVIVDLLSAVVYYVCKKDGISKSMTEISKVMNVPTKRIYKNLRVVNEAYGTITDMPSLDSYVSKCFSRTELPAKYEKEVIKYLKILQKQNFHQGKSPTVLVGAIMKYILLNSFDIKNVTFVDISKACDISDVSLRNMCDRVTPIIQTGVE